MKITTRITWDMQTGAILELAQYDYEGPIAKCDRAAQAAAKSAAGTAAGVAGTDESLARSKEAALDPFFRREMGASHYFDPNQINELLTASGAGAGAEEGAERAQLERQATATNNPTALTKNLQDLARNRMKTMAGGAEGIAAQDVMGAKQLNQLGAQGETGLFQTDTDAALKAMGIDVNAINTEIEAGKSGWLQNTLNTVKTLSGLGNPFASKQT